jgi:hypothetical protein
LFLISNFNLLVSIIYFPPFDDKKTKKKFQELYINFLEAMAIRFLALFQVLIIYSTFLHIILPQNSCNASNIVPKLKQCGFDAIYNLGTSISDTGNSAIDNPSIWQAMFPYGKTINEATGRPSDGLLIIDYIGEQTIFFFLCVLRNNYYF